MIFCESFIPHKLQADRTRNLIAATFISSHKTRSPTALIWITSARNTTAATQTRPAVLQPVFQIRSGHYGLGSSANVDMNLNSEDAGKGNSGNALVEGIATLLDNVLDKPFTAFGAKVETSRRAEGVYPPKEIYIPRRKIRRIASSDYTDDVARRKQTGQLKPGEDVNIDPTDECRFPARSP